MSTSTQIPAQSSAALYGKGVFTTLAIVSSTPFLWKKHWSRLTKNAAVIGIDLSEFSESVVSDALARSIAENKVINGRARITFFDESSGIIWPFETTRKTCLVITTGDFQPTPNNLRLTVSLYTVNSHSPLAGVKSCNYLDKIIALNQAKSRGFDEAIMVNERGEITSAVMANVFWLKNEVIYTPSLKTGCLPGTTREFISESLECREVEATLDELDRVDAIFLTSAGLGIVQAAQFELRQFEERGHPILEVIESVPKSAKNTNIHE